MNLILSGNLLRGLYVCMFVVLQFVAVKSGYGKIDHAVEYSRLSEAVHNCTGVERLEKLLLLAPHAAALHVDSALKVNMQALTLLRKIPDRSKKAKVLHSLARCHLILCNYTQTDSLLREAQDHTDSVSSERASIYRTMGELALRTPDIDVARIHLANSIDMYLQLGQDVEAWYSRVVLIEHLLGNKMSDAYDDITTGLAFADSVDDRKLKNLLLVELAYLHSYCSNRTESVRISKQLLDDYHGTNDRYMIARLMSVQADMFNFYNSSSSRQWFEQAQEALIELDDHYYRARAYLRMSLSGAGYTEVERYTFLDSAEALSDRHNMVIAELPLWRSWHVGHTDSYKAIALALETYRITPKLGKKTVTMIAARNLSNFYIDIQDSANAYKYLTEYEALYQTLRGPEHTVLLGKIESKMASDKVLEQQKTIAAAREQLKETEIQRQKTTRNVLIGASALLIIVLLVIYFSYKREKRTKQTIAIQNENLERMDRLNKEVFSVISHDFKGPLLSLSILTEHLESVQMNAEQITAYSGEINNQVKQTSLMLENLLNWSRAELQLDTYGQVRCKPMQICEETKATLAPLSAGKSIEIINEIPKGIAASIHPDILRIVLRNLLGNAIKFSNNNQKIHVGFDESTASYFVKDNGIGISANVKPNLFKKAVLSELGTNLESGFGLGLYITSELLRKSGWELAVNSKGRQGTTFSFHPA